MTPRPGERGAALLSVLLLVAVMATVAATALDRLGIATRLTGNSIGYAQARWWVTTAELLTSARLEDMAAADPAQTLRGPWLGTERSIDLPDGGRIRARVEDGGNCLNLNSLVEDRGGQLVARAAGAKQLVALMRIIGIAEGEATRIAAAATDYLDTDTTPAGTGTEQGAANALMVDASELRALPGVTARHLQLLDPWLCALPTAELSPLNVNTLLPEQAPLLSMLDPAKIDLNRARAQIASRPSDGFESTVEFWNSPVMAGAQVADDAARQVRLRTSFFTLRTVVTAADLTLTGQSLLDARGTPVRLVRREWGEGA